MGNAINFTDRCNIAAACLPRDEYRASLERLHAEMLAAIAVREMVEHGPTPMDRFEGAIREVGTVAACEWFGHTSDSEFTQETIRVLNERAATKGKP